MIREILFALVAMCTLGYFAYGMRMLIRALRTGGKGNYFDNVPGRPSRLHIWPGAVSDSVSWWKRIVPNMPLLSME